MVRETFRVRGAIQMDIEHSARRWQQQRKAADMPGVCVLIYQVMGGYEGRSEEREPPRGSCRHIVTIHPDCTIEVVGERPPAVDATRILVDRTMDPAYRPTPPVQGAPEPPQGTAQTRQDASSEQVSTATSTPGPAAPTTAQAPNYGSRKPVAPATVPARTKRQPPEGVERATVAAVEDHGGDGAQSAAD